MSESESQSQVGPPKVPYFYLSHARADDDSSVHDFFTDLSYSIRFKAKLTDTEVVGRWNTSGKERDEALRTSRVMIAMLSPAYLKDRAALLEWQIFEFRRRCALLASHLSNRETLKRSIIPICWSPFSGSMPMEIRQTPLFEGDLKSGPNVTSGVQSLTDDQRAAFVKSLAQYIIEVTSSFHLTPLEAIPDEVPNLFADRDEPEMNSETTNAMPNKNPNQNINQNVTQNLYIDGAFVRSVAEQTKAMPAKPSTQENQPKSDERYSVVVVDNDKELLDLIKTTCDYSDQFNCITSEDPQKVLDDTNLDWYRDQYAPDIFVIDLELGENTMHGLELINKLIDEVKIPSAIMATSGNLSGRRLLEVVGTRRAVRAVSKPLDQDNLLAEMRDLAEIGRNRILYQKDPDAFFDETRNQRPVFLSYSSLDEETATAISNSFENKRIFVFFAPDSIRGGENVLERIRSGLRQAAIFVPLISGNFGNSRYCLAELANALDMQKRRKKERPLHVIPVLLDSPDTDRLPGEIRRCIRENKPLTISPDNLVDGIQKILIRAGHYLHRS